MNGFKIIQNTPSIVWLNKFYIEDRIDANNYNSLFLNIKDKIFQINNKNVRFRDIVKNINNGIEARDYSEQGRPYLRVSDLKDFNIDYNNICRININYNDIPEKAKVQIGDLLISRSGTIGIAKAVKEEDLGIVISSHIINVSIDTSKVDIDYLSTFINSRYGKLMIEQLSNGGVIKEISHDRLLSLIIPIPSPEIQKYIGDKIRKAEELREEAKTLQNEINTILNDGIGKFNEEDARNSNFNWISGFNIEDRIDPNFYQKKYISIIIKLGENRIRLKEYVKISKLRYGIENSYKYIEISNINNSFGTIENVEELDFEKIPTSAKYQVKEGDILVSLVRPTRKAISIVTKEYDNSICTGGFAVLKSKGKVPVEFLTAVLRTDFVRMQFERYCAGSTYPTIDEKDVLDIFIPVYSKNQINEVSKKYSKVINNIYKSKQLIQEAKQDVEDLIEGNFDMSKVKANN